MSRTKVMTVVGTRPEIIRLSRVLPKLDKHVDHVLVHTGQNYDYELNEVFFKDLGLRKPDHFLNAAEEGASAAETIGHIIARIDPLLVKEKPDAFLVLGDTNSCLSVIAARRRKVPVFHMEAGNRCFDRRVPEELNRKIVDHASDFNLPYSDIARSYLLAEGFPADRIIKTGSPMAEVLEAHRAAFAASTILETLKLKPREFFVVSFHREENVEDDASLDGLAEAINRIAEKYGKPVIVSTHPRTRKRIEARKIQFHSGVSLLKPLGFIDYVRLEQEALAVLSDSGTITEESSILNFPALNLRDSHERPEGMEEASVILAGVKPERILAALEVALRQPRGDERAFAIPADYRALNVSDKVLRLILSYRDYLTTKP